MTKNTSDHDELERDSGSESDRDWVAEVSEIWKGLAASGKKPNSTEVVKALAARWKISGATASGLLAGFSRLVSYARGELAAGVSALDEERSSVQAALRAVRPVLQARLPQRWDQADEQCPEVIGASCGQRCQSQGRRERSWRSTVGPLPLTRR
jgi:hypothetical protein